MSDIIVKTANARQDVATIGRIIKSIDEDLQKLQKYINDNIPQNIETAWAERLKSDWNKHYTSDIPATLSEMRLTATNLEQAVAKAEEFSAQQ